MKDERIGLNDYYDTSFILPSQDASEDLEPWLLSPNQDYQKTEINDQNLSH
jgi:hypothetical protein